MMLRGRGLTAAKCGEQVSFTIDGSQAGTGTPHVQIFSPTSEVDVVLQHLGKFQPCVFEFDGFIFIEGEKCRCLKHM